MNLKTQLYLAKTRTANRWHDLLATLHGYCNHRPIKSGTPGDGGGYHHWRCALRRSHDGDHRFVNYTWDADGRTDFAPLDHPPSQPWDRYATLTRRQQRERKRWDAERYEATLRRLAAEKESSG